MSARVAAFCLPLLLTQTTRVPAPWPGKRYPERVDVKLLLAYAREQAAAGTIDGLGNLSGTPVYLYRGTKDACCAHPPRTLARICMHVCER